MSENSPGHPSTSAVARAYQTLFDMAAGSVWDEIVVAIDTDQASNLNPQNSG